MKNYFNLLTSILFLAAFSFSTEAQDVITKKQSKFVSKFVGAVNVHKAKKVYKMVDKTYKAKFNGSEETLSSLFAGRVQKTGEYSKVPFNKIYDIRIFEVNEIQPTITLYKFILVTPEGPVETNLYLKANKKGAFGFQPAQN